MMVKEKVKNKMSIYCLISTSNNQNGKWLNVITRLNMRYCNVIILEENGKKK